MSQFSSELEANPQEALFAFKVWRREADENWPYPCGRRKLTRLRRRKSSKVQALPCGILLVFEQIFFRYENLLGRK